MSVRFQKNSISAVKVISQYLLKEKERVNKVLNKLSNMTLSDKAHLQKNELEHEYDMVENMIDRFNE